MANKKAAKLKAKEAQQAKRCLYLRLSILANLLVLGFFAFAIPMLQAQLNNSTVPKQQALLDQLQAQHTINQQQFYRQQQAISALSVQALNDKPTPKLIKLCQQLIKQEADIQDFIYYSQKASFDLAALIDAKEWAYSKEQAFRPFINSSRKRQMRLRQMAKVLKEAEQAIIVNLN